MTINTTKCRIPRARPVTGAAGRICDFFRENPRILATTTRSTTTKQKALQSALRTLCRTLIQDFANPASRWPQEKCVTSYFKLVEYLNRVREVTEQLLGSATDYAAELIEAEGFEQQCIETCEKLYVLIPADHALRSSNPPHLKIPSQRSGYGDPAGGGDGAKKADQDSLTKALQKPKLEEFDGKKSLWPLWKATFEKGIHENKSLELEQKFFYLVSNLKKGSFAHRIVMTYVDIENGYELAWKDLTAHYKTACDTKSTHVAALRDLHKKCKISDSKNFHQLQSLYQTAKSRVNALKALGAEPASYESLAVLGIKEALPFDIRVKFFLDHDEDSDGKSCLEDMLNFMKKEIQARRKSWDVEPKKPDEARKKSGDKAEKDRKPWSKAATKFAAAKDGNRKQTPAAATKQKETRHSSMLQATDHEVPSDDTEEASNHLN